MLSGNESRDQDPVIIRCTGPWKIIRREGEEAVVGRAMPMRWRRKAVLTNYCRLRGGKGIGIVLYLLPVLNPKSYEGNREVVGREDE